MTCHVADRAIVRVANWLTLPLSHLALPRILLDGDGAGAVVDKQTKSRRGMGNQRVGVENIACINKIASRHPCRVAVRQQHLCMTKFTLILKEETTKSQNRIGREKENLIFCVVAVRF